MGLHVLIFQKRERQQEVWPQEPLWLNCILESTRGRELLLSILPNPRRTFTHWCLNWRPRFGVGSSEALFDSFDYFLSYYTSSGGYPTLDQLQSRLMLEEIRRQTRSRLKSATIEALYFHSNRSYTHHNQHMKGSNPSSPNFSTAHYTTQGHENNMPQNQHTLCHYYGKLEHFKHMCPERLVDIRKLKS